MISEQCHQNIGKKLKNAAIQRRKRSSKFECLRYQKIELLSYRILRLHWMVFNRYHEPPTTTNLSLDEIRRNIVSESKLEQVAVWFASHRQAVLRTLKVVTEDATKIPVPRRDVVLPRRPLGSSRPIPPRGDYFLSCFLLSNFTGEQWFLLCLHSSDAKFSAFDRFPCILECCVSFVCFIVCGGRLWVRPTADLPTPPPPHPPHTL